jgi:hypothetical protein
MECDKLIIKPAVCYELPVFSYVFSALFDDSYTDHIFYPVELFDDLIAEIDKSLATLSVDQA